MWSLSCTLAELNTEVPIWVLEISSGKSMAGEDCDDSVERLKLKQDHMGLGSYPPYQFHHP